METGQPGRNIDMEATSDIPSMILMSSGGFRDGDLVAFIGQKRFDDQLVNHAVFDDQYAAGHGNAGRLHLPRRRPITQRRRQRVKQGASAKRFRQHQFEQLGRPVD